MAIASALVDGALEDIELLEAKIVLCDYRQLCDLKVLKVGLRNVRAFLLYARGSNSSSMMGSLLSWLGYSFNISSGTGSLLRRLEDSLIKNGEDFHNLCLRQKEYYMSRDLYQGIIQLEKCVKTFSREIMESYITLSDYRSRQCRYPSEEFLDSLLLNMADITRGTVLFPSQDQDLNLNDALKDKQKFLKNFIRFAELRGFEPCQLQILFTQLHVVAVNAARLCNYWMLVPYAEFLSKFSEYIQKIKPVDPQIREIFVRVLTASNVSRSSHVLTLETDKHVLGDFIDSLLCQIEKALSYGDSYMLSLKDQVPILYEGLRFLRTILTKHLEKIDELDKKAKYLIGAAINESAIVICLHPVHESGEVLFKEALLNFLEKIKLIKVITSASVFPKSNEHDFIDFLLENVEGLLSCRVDSIAFAKDQIQTIQQELVSLRSFLENILDDLKHDGKLQRLWNRVIELAYKTHFVLLSVVVGDTCNCSPLEFRTIIEEINLIKLESLKIVDNHCNYDSEVQKATNSSNTLPSRGGMQAINKIVVTLDDEEKKIKEYLTSGSKNLDIISIVGMPGLGKTTLARSVYDNPSVRDLFHTSAWCVVSQAYKKKDLLLRILGFVDPNCGDKYSEMDEMWLEHKLKKCLLRRRYLIVLDDIWDIDAWSTLKSSFPDDANSSRILLTSRDFEVAKNINPNRQPHPLRQLTDIECWDLLQDRLSCIKSYPLDLGKKIAKNCRGLPLTVVIIAGILVNSNQDCWEEIAEKLSLSALSDTDQCIDILELSFRKLPQNLKSCLLYFGLIPDEREIPVKKLICFWIAEGFIEKSEPKSLEDVARDCMNDLISRSLIMVSKERSTGGVKTCRIHDLLHEFCVVKAKNKKFLSLLRRHDELFSFLGQPNLQRLCVHSTSQDFEKSKLCCPGIRSLLFFTKGDDHSQRYNISFIFHFFKLLRVLDLMDINLGSTFPIEIPLLVELRHLAISGTFESIPSAIAKLSNLETLLVNAFRILLPNTIWNMQKLRMLWSAGYFFLDDLAIDNPESSSNLPNLHTFSILKLSWQSLEKILRKLPNIRTLKCGVYISRESHTDCNGIVVMEFLSRLESLHLCPFHDTPEYNIGFRFPENLMKLSLSTLYSRIIPKRGELPNLVVLKLEGTDFEGSAWEMNEEWEFPNLKFLALFHLSIERWTGTDGVNHFPLLEKLVLQGCRKLKVVPSCLGEITTLQMIKVNDCSKSIASLIMQIKKDQKDNWGIEDLQVVLTNITEEVKDEPTADEMKNDPSENEMEDETSDEE